MKRYVFAGRLYSKTAITNSCEVKKVIRYYWIVRHVLKITTSVNKLNTYTIFLLRFSYNISQLEYIFKTKQ